MCGIESDSEIYLNLGIRNETIERRYNEYTNSEMYYDLLEEVFLNEDGTKWFPEDNNLDDYISDDVMEDFY